MSVILVKLNQNQMETSSLYGLLRCMNKTAGSHSLEAFNRTTYIDNIARNIEAVAAEIAVAKLLGLDRFVPTLNTYKEQADIGKAVEVKYTRWKDGHLIVTDNDNIKDIAVLVTGDAPALYVCGWIPITMAKQKHFQKGSGSSKSWWIGQKDLFEINDLKESNYASAYL